MPANMPNPVKKSNLTAIAFGFIALALAFGAWSVFETNLFGNYQIKQAAITGEITVINEPGMYFRNFGTITTYPISEDIDFEESNMSVRFNDGSIAKVKGTVKFRMPLNEEKQKELHRDYSSFKNVVIDLIQKNTAESLSQTATLMAAEESYSTRRAEFASTAEQQLKRGIFKVQTKEVDSVDEMGTKFKKKITEVVVDKDGNPAIQKPSLVRAYGIEILQFVVNDFRYDEKVEAMISKKKEYENQKMVAATEAETAKQNAITEQEQGKARVAKAEADALVLKKTAVTEAEKNAEVARLDAIKAQQEAIAIKARGEAEAHAAKLKVQAGLTPLEKARIDMETADKVSKNLANVKFPEFLVISGGDKGGSINPFDAVGLQSLYDLSKKLSNTKP